MSLSADTVSVIVPCYNQGLFIVDAIESVILQNHPATELIVVDDGSTDPETIRVLDELASSERIRLIRTVNRGLASARNIGLAASKGEFIQFLDSDDVIIQEKWSRQLAQLRAHPEIDVSITDFFLGNADLTLLEPPYWTSISLSETPLVDFLYRWETELSIPIHCALFRRKILGKDPFPVGYRSKEDWIMWVRICLRGASFGTIDASLATYRQHGANMGSNVEEMAAGYVFAAFEVARLLVPAERSKFEVHASTHLPKAYFPRVRREALLAHARDSRQVNWFRRGTSLIFNAGRRLRRVLIRNP